MKHPSIIKSYSELPKEFQKALCERNSLEEIQKMTREDVVREKVAWEMGDERWYDLFSEWLELAGFKIELKI